MNYAGFFVISSGRVSDTNPKRYSAEEDVSEIRERKEPLRRQGCVLSLLLFEPQDSGGSRILTSFRSYILHSFPLFAGALWEAK